METKKIIIKPFFIEYKVQQLKNLFDGGMSILGMANHFDVSRPSIRNQIKKNSWVR